MSAQFKHKRYFRMKNKQDNSPVTFSSTADALTKIGFKDVYNTNSPTKTEALEDSGQTLVVTYEFSSESDQTGFKTAIDNVWGDSTEPWAPPSTDENYQIVEHFKTEWLHQDGSVSSTVNL